VKQIQKMTSQCENVIVNFNLVKKITEGQKALVLKLCVSVMKAAQVLCVI
jgi:hypothetical protein